MATSLRSIPDLTSGNASVLPSVGENESAAVHADFGAIYREYAPHIYRYCYRCLGSREDAEDATSQVFTQALAHLDRLRDDNVRPWLYRIAHNVVIDVVRKRRSVNSIDDERNEPAGITSIESELDQRELQVLLEGAISSLSERDRQLVFLRFAGLTGAEIASVLHCSHGAVRVAHHRALDRLRVILIEQGNLDG